MSSSEQPRHPHRPVQDVAHDLCNLLTVMGVQVERMLMELPDNPRLQRAGEAMDEALERANQLTAALLGPANVCAATPAEAHTGVPPCDGGLALVVEDDRQVRQVLSAMLLSRGCQVRACACAAEARAVVASNADELVLALLDANLPDDSGVRLLSDLRRSLPGLPVVFVTGSTGDDLLPLLDARTALLTKPFRAAELSSVVDRVRAGAGASP